MAGKWIYRAPGSLLPLVRFAHSHLRSHSIPSHRNLNQLLLRLVHIREVVSSASSLSPSTNYAVPPHDMNSYLYEYVPKVRCVLIIFAGFAAGRTLKTHSGFVSPHRVVRNDLRGFTARFCSLFCILGQSWIELAASARYDTRVFGYRV